MTCPQQPIKHTRGDTLSFTGEVVADGVAVNIAGGSIVYTIRDNQYKEGEALITGSATITNAAQGLYEISTPCSLDIGVYYFDVQFTDSQGGIFTLYKGPIEITYDIT